MAAIFAYAGQKGGSGKSTLAIATADEFHRRGFKTLLVDTDPQGSSATWGAVASEVATDDPAYTYPDVIAMGPNLHQQLPNIAQAYDVVVIDCPGWDGERQRGALAVADVVLLPVTPDTTDIWAMSHTLDLVNQASTYRPGLRACLLLNKMRAGTAEAREARDLLKPTGLPVMNTEIGLRVVYGRFGSAGVGVTSYEPKGKAAQEVCDLTRELADLGEMRWDKEVACV